MRATPEPEATLSDTLCWFRGLGNERKGGDLIIICIGILAPMQLEVSWIYTNISNCLAYSKVPQM